MRRAIERLVFIDETSTNTKLTKLTGWAPVGERFYGHAPFGHWQTQTFIAALRCHESQIKEYKFSDPFTWVKNRCREMAEGEDFEFAEGFHRVVLPK